MATSESVIVKQMSDLQTDASSVVAEAERGSIEIRRYSQPVAYIESVEQHRENVELRSALNRAIWAVDLARALRNVREGKFREWDEAAALLKKRYSTKG